ncbi:MAG: ATP-dependent zinc metalloprotease FtsH [Candidatus Omnitrophica bacterium]|nr:ATP-dependent zinc metalloprotease FtsH [Candidatus Omnitrophota bacterium]MBU4478326.1 ATP-dependent zinc metalloprotease FtsH [Candidatus Omnitrophota bacterium]
MVLTVLFFMGLLSEQYARTLQPKITYSEFFAMVQNNKTSHEIAAVELAENTAEVRLSNGKMTALTVPLNDADLIRALRENVDNFTIKQSSLFWLNILSLIWPLFILGMIVWFTYRSSQMGGNRLFSFGKSRVHQPNENNVKITFNDVAGVDEAKEELQEIIEFLKDPKKFQRLGGKIPKGVLLMGPPGTGKTLLAKAVAGEAGVPFLSISGSDFVEMFVGVGASRVRDLFEQAKKASKASGRGSIIFIDEIDAVGRQRFAGVGGGHDEREQTLNALLVEMDGFNTQEGVILMAATNRPDVLDPALLRPGRFDRQIVLDRPDIIGRESILKVHVRNVKLHESVDLNSIARQTPGFSGADIANLVNEAALLAARRSKDAVTMEELQASIERVVAGPERKSRVMNKHEKEVVAYHESGHALLSMLVPGVDPLHKVSIIPRGTAALGYTMNFPLEDKYLASKSELLGELVVFLGGRVSEELIFNEITTGAHNDLSRGTQIARRMVCEYGMSKALGHLTFGHRPEHIFLGRDILDEKNYSEQTAVLIDQEVRKIIDDCYALASSLLSDNIDKLKKLAEALLEKEVMDSDEVRKLLGIPEEKEPAHEEKKEPAAGCAGTDVGGPQEGNLSQKLDESSVIDDKAAA